MDLYSILDKELKNMHLNELEKIRYIYIRICELFTYDLRYKYISNFTNVNVLNENNDIHNIKDNRIICTSVSEYIANCLKELVGIDTKVEGYGHKYVSTDKYILDCTHDDILSLKYKFEPSGFVFKENNLYYKSILFEIDKTIGYIKNLYINNFIRQFKIYRNYPLIDRMNKLNYLFNYLSNNSYESDSFHLFLRLRFIFDLSELNDTNFSSTNYDNPNFVKLINIDKNHLYAIKLLDGIYKLLNITEAEYLNIYDNMVSYNKYKVKIK